MLPVVLTIAGSDSGGGAGIQADLKTFAALHVYGASVITAVTAQNTLGVSAIHTIPADVVAAQIASVVTDLRPSAVKIGMLSTAEIVAVVAAQLRTFLLSPVVVDPVMVAKGGDRLLAPEAIQALIEELLPLATVLTPNVPEAETLLNRRIGSLEDMEHAARDLAALGPRDVVVKGGHLSGAMATDILYDGTTKELRRYTVSRIATVHTHGTGCTFSSAIAAYLALGEPVRTAVENAKTYLTGAIANAPGLGAGNGPVRHDWQHAGLPPRGQVA